MKRLFYLCLITLMFCACAPTVSYVGKSYPVSDQVDIFYSKEDVKKSYETMGYAEAKTGIFEMSPSSKSLQECQTELQKEAKKRGADGVIIDGIGTIVTTSGSDGNVSSTESKNIKATFIKYK